MNLFDYAKAELFRSNADHRHPFRYFYLATIGSYPEVRTVVKRRVDPDLTLLFFTDARSPKVEQIRSNAKVSALFYHPKKKLQIRMKGQAALVSEEDEDFRQFLNQIRQSPALKDYTTREAPGSVVNDEAELLFGPEVYFLPVRLRPLYLDILQLGKERHQRSAYSWKEGEWQEERLVP